MITIAKLNINFDVKTLNLAYIPYIKREERYQVFYGGAGSGKSYFLATNLVLELLSKKQKMLVIREVFSTIRDSVYAELLNAIDNIGNLREHCTISKSTLQITFPNGSTIIFKGADDESKLLSITGVDMVWIEEADGITREVWHQIELRLRGGANKKRFYLSFNPISAQHWLKEEFFDNPKDDSLICHTTYKDNRFLDADYIANLEDMRERNPEKYQVYALGKWGTNGKPVYSNWEVSTFNFSQIIKSNKSIKALFGMDFGYTTDPTTFIASLIDEQNRKLYIFDEMYEHGLLNNEIAHNIISMGYGKETIIADSAEQKSIAELRKYGLRRVKPAKKGANSINHGIQYLSQYQIYIHPNCVETINEFENYSYKKNKRTGQYTNVPIDNYNHLLDALRYSVEPLSMQKKPVSSLNKAMFGL